MRLPILPILLVLILSVHPGRADSGQDGKNSPLNPQKLPNASALWVGLSDVIKYVPGYYSEARAIQIAMQKDPRFIADGARFKYDLHFEDAPTVSGSLKSYTAVALMNSPKAGDFFRRFLIVTHPATKEVTEVSVLEDIPVKNTHFDISVGLVDRMLVLEDVYNDITMVYPIGVGGVDPGVMSPGTRILTPEFHGAKLEKRRVIAKRTMPAYYRGEPFMPITTGHGTETPIGFHITIIYDDADWKKLGPNYLVRGFDSHGCMRLRQKDLHELFDVVMESPGDSVPVDIDYYVYYRDANMDRNESEGQMKQVHPYPLRQDSYQRVKNFAAPGEAPLAKRDPKENLVILEAASGKPDFSQLVGFDASDITDLSVFDGFVEQLSTTPVTSTPVTAPANPGTPEPATPPSPAPVSAPAPVIPALQP